MTLMFSHAASTLLWNINGWPQRRYSPGRTAITSDTAETLRDLTSPSGVSEGHSMPHWDGWRDRGPLTFLVFSNWEEILVIMPKADIYDKRDSTWVTPWRSILNLFRDQLPWRERRDMRPPGTTLCCLTPSSRSERLCTGTANLWNQSHDTYSEIKTSQSKSSQVTHWGFPAI